MPIAPNTNNLSLTGPLGVPTRHLPVLLKPVEAGHPKFGIFAYCTVHVPAANGYTTEAEMLTGEHAWPVDDEGQVMTFDAPEDAEAWLDDVRDAGGPDWAGWRTAVGPETPSVIQVNRAYAGLVIKGPHLKLLIVPGEASGVRFRLIAQPGFCESDGEAHYKLGTEDMPRSFALDEIEMSGEQLTCLSKGRHFKTNRFREGFTVELDPGMGDLIRPWLAPIARIAATAEAIEQRIGELMEPPYAHMLEFIGLVVARRVLDGLTASVALDTEAQIHWAGKESVYMGHIRGDKQIHYLLQMAVPELALSRPWL